MPADLNVLTADKISYEDSRTLAQHEDADVRRRLAGRTDVRPEVLYYLADDPDPGVRGAIARNEAAPGLVDLRLVNDNDETVRAGLAEKIAQLAPGLTANEQNRVKARTYQALEELVRDQATRVRQVLAEILKDMTDAPHEVISALARDVEILVSGPVLEHSPVLTEADLLEIIANDPIAGALNSIAVRSTVSGEIAAAIVATNDSQAVAHLLENPNAQIQEETLDWILERAPEVGIWHEPLVRRPQLPTRAATRVASFVAENLLQVLHDRTDFPDEVLAEIDFEFRRRFYGGKGDDENGGETTNDTAGAAHPSEDAVRAALADGDQETVLASIAELAGADQRVVGKIIASANGKTIAAIVWKAGLSMDLALALQVDLARVPKDQVVKPTDDGGFPLTQEELKWELYFHGIV